MLDAVPADVLEQALAALFKGRRLLRGIRRSMAATCSGAGLISLSKSFAGVERAMLKETAPMLPGAACDCQCRVRTG